MLGIPIGFKIIIKVSILSYLVNILFATFQSSQVQFLLIACFLLYELHFPFIPS